MSDQGFTIPKWLNQDFLEVVLRKKFPTEDVEVHHYTIKVGTNQGDGFSSEIFRVTIDSSLGKFPLLLKKPHEIPERHELMKSYDLYNREIHFYNEHYPALKEILESVDEFEDLAPEMFYVDELTQLVVLCDCRSDGFKTSDRNIRVPRQSASIVLRKLAKLHASSLILNKSLDGRPSQQEYKLYGGPLDEIFVLNIKSLTKEMKSWGSYYEQLSPKMEYCALNYHKLIAQNVPSKQGLDVLIHGDPWFNNILIRSEPQEDALLIDFQTVSWGSLAIDLIYFTIMSLNEEDFDDREELIRDYQGHLERVLGKLNWTKIPSYEEILIEFKEKFFHALYSMLMKALSGQDPSEQSLEQMVDEDEEEMMSKFRSTRIKRELMNLTKLMNEYGALDVEVC